MAMAIRGGCGFDLEDFDAGAFPMLSQYTANPYRKPYCRDALAASPANRVSEA
jgi:hypothetical protein